jgi:hypothetical protein
MFNAGIFNLDLVADKKSGSQGSLLSPFLFNVYMSELDTFAEKLIKKGYCRYTRLEKKKKNHAGSKCTKVTTCAAKPVLSGFKDYHTFAKVGNVMYFLAVRFVLGE